MFVSNSPTSLKLISFEVEEIAGTIPDPLLFILYVNDILKNICIYGWHLDIGPK